jgi:hypothetical protein
MCACKSPEARDERREPLGAATLALECVFQRFYQSRDWGHGRLLSENANNLLHSSNLIILFEVDLPLSMGVVQDLLLRLREFPVELTSHSGELASIRTVYARGDTLYNELGPLTNSFDPDICLGGWVKCRRVQSTGLAGL